MRIIKFDKIDSTNKYLKEQILNKKAKEYDIIIAKKQSAGVGRRGNKWISEEGMALFSFVVKDRDISLVDVVKIPLIAGMATLSALKKIENIEFLFKWTNDVYLQGKKLSGILVEKVEDYFVVGVGINVNNRNFGELHEKATSLSAITGKNYNIDDIIYTVVNEFKKYLKIFTDMSNGWKMILDEINYYNYLKGKEIKVEKYGEIIGEGIADNIDFQGRLEVLIDNNKKYFNIGEIHIKKN